MSSRTPSRASTSSSSDSLFVPNNDPAPLYQLIPGLKSLEEARASFKLVTNNIVFYIFTNYILSRRNPEHRWLLTKPLWDELWSHSIHTEQEIRSCKTRLTPGKECVVALGVDHSSRIMYHACLRSTNLTDST